MSLSMKEVDQDTGEDLNPGSVKRSAAGSSSREEDMVTSKNPGKKYYTFINLFFRQAVPLLIGEVFGKMVSGMAFVTNDIHL